jgi:hypothetical protein
VLIEEELSGILNFAMHGYTRLKTRGYYDPPPAMVAALDEVREANQPLVKWMVECLAPAAHIEVDNRDLVASLSGWWAQEYGDGERAPGGRTLHAALKRRYPMVQAIKSHGQRLSIGIELTDEGLACLQHARDNSFGKAVGSGLEKALVNRKTTRA